MSAGYTGHGTDPGITLDLRRPGRPDFIVPLQGERRYGGYRAVSHTAVRRTEYEEVYEVVVVETGEEESPALTAELPAR
jgi:hypothetical protein